MSYNRGFQTIQGPTDPMLRHSEIEGYQPVSRIGEVVINCFIDSYEHSALPAHGAPGGHRGDGPACRPPSRCGLAARGSP